RQAEESGPRVAGLRTRRQRPDLDVAETEPQHRAGNLGVLVESGGETQRVRKLQSESGDDEPRVPRPGRRDLHAEDGEAVRGFRRKKLDERLGELGQPHASRLPKSWRPSGSSGSGRDQSTALSGSAA